MTREDGPSSRGRSRSRSRSPPPRDQRSVGSSSDGKQQQQQQKQPQKDAEYWRQQYQKSVSKRHGGDGADANASSPKSGGGGEEGSSKKAPASAPGGRHQKRQQRVAPPRDVVSPSAQTAAEKGRREQSLPATAATTAAARGSSGGRYPRQSDAVPPASPREAHGEHGGPPPKKGVLETLPVVPAASASASAGGKRAEGKERDDGRDGREGAAAAEADVSSSSRPAAAAAGRAASPKEGGAAAVAPRRGVGGGSLATAAAVEKKRPPSLSKGGFIPSSVIKPRRWPLPEDLVVGKKKGGRKGGSPFKGNVGRPVRDAEGGALGAGAASSLSKKAKERLVAAVDAEDRRYRAAAAAAAIARDERPDDVGKSDKPPAVARRQAAAPSAASTRSLEENAAGTEESTCVKYAHDGSPAQEVVGNSAVVANDERAESNGVRGEEIDEDDENACGGDNVVARGVDPAGKAHVVAASARAQRGESPAQQSSPVIIAKVVPTHGEEEEEAGTYAEGDDVPNQTTGARPPPTGDGVTGTKNTTSRSSQDQVVGGSNDAADGGPSLSEAVGGGEAKISPTVDDNNVEINDDNDATSTRKEQSSGGNGSNDAAGGGPSLSEVAAGAAKTSSAADDNNVEISNDDDAMSISNEQSSGANEGRNSVVLIDDGDGISIDGPIGKDGEDDVMSISSSEEVSPPKDGSVSITDAAGGGPSLSEIAAGAAKTSSAADDNVEINNDDDAMSISNEQSSGANEGINSVVLIDDGDGIGTDGPVGKDGEDDVMSIGSSEEVSPPKDGSVSVTSSRPNHVESGKQNAAGEMKAAVEPLSSSSKDKALSNEESPRSVPSSEVKSNAKSVCGKENAAPCCEDCNERIPLNHSGEPMACCLKCGKPYDAPIAESSDSDESHGDDGILQEKRPCGLNDGTARDSEADDSDGRRTSSSTPSLCPSDTCAPSQSSGKERTRSLSSSSSSDSTSSWTPGVSEPEPEPEPEPSSGTGNQDDVISISSDSDSSDYDSSDDERSMNAGRVAPCPAICRLRDIPTAVGTVPRQFPHASDRSRTPQLATEQSREISTAVRRQSENGSSPVPRNSDKTCHKTSPSQLVSEQAREKDQGENGLSLDAKLRFSDVLSAETCRLLSKNGINHPSELLDSKCSFQPEIMRIAERFRSSDGMEALLRLAKRRATQPNKSGKVLPRKRRQDESATDKGKAGQKLQRTLTSKHPPASETPVVRIRMRYVSELGTMHAVPQLTRTVFDSFGKPQKYVTVYNDQYDIIYCFRVDIGTSRIPNSGNGAFLTYLGAKMLIPDKRAMNADIIESVMAELEPISTKQPLTAKMSSGSNASVTLSGKGLHENGGSIYWPITRYPMRATLFNAKRSIGVKVAGAKLHDEVDELLAARNLQRGEEGMGFRGLFKESDYVDEDLIPFCSYSPGCCLIDLGRYGPFRKEDRKRHMDFVVKDFLFDHEPAAWNFGCNERLRGDSQIIDVTEDCTGEPHTCAQEHISMYVNEVGHNENLVHNVLAREVDDRVVHYYLHLEKPIKKGETVELLTDYHHMYEPTRERKGYGLANVKNGVKDDTDANTRLGRNLKERYHVEDTINTMSARDVMESLRFLRSNILEKVVGSTKWYIQKDEMARNYARDNATEEGAQSPAIPPPPSRQWVARRRMHWMGERFRARIAEIQNTAQRGFVDEHLREVEETLAMMKWESLDELYPFMNKIKIWCGKSLLHVMVADLEEELFHAATAEFLFPLDESMWCPLAVQLMKLSVKQIVAYLLAGKDEAAENDLVQMLLSDAEKVASQVRESCNIVGNPKSSMDKFDRALDALQFQPCSTASGAGWTLLHQFFGVETQKVEQNTKSVIVTGTPTTLGTVHPFAHDKEALRSGEGESLANESWYLLWQVVFVVHTLARRCLGEPATLEASSEHYSLQKLCNRIGVDFAIAKDVYERGLAKSASLQHIVHAHFAGAHQNEGKPQKSHKSRGSSKGSSKASAKAGTSQKGSSSEKKVRVNRVFFLATIWKALQKLGWTMECTGREQGRNDCYYFPPGVSKGKGFTTRVDFFDSLPQVFDFIQQDGRWKDRDEVKRAVQLYRRGFHLYEQLKASKKLAKGWTAEGVLCQLSEKDKYDKSA